MAVDGKLQSGKVECQFEVWAVLKLVHRRAGVHQKLLAAVRQAVCMIDKQVSEKKNHQRKLDSRAALLE